MTDQPGEDRPANAIDSHRSPSRVREVYDEIASHFSKTRAYPWPEIEAFLEDAGTASLGLDVGCGNGRHTALLAETCETAIGLELSRALLEEARAAVTTRGVSWVQGDAASVSLATNSVGIGLYVATLHHLPNRDARIASLDELDRVLEPGAMALVSAWSTAHDRFETEREADTGFDTTIDWTLPGGETIPRFYHIYAPAEFEADIAASGLELDSFEISSGNCYARVSPGK